ncbi:MAG: MBL fold metallo-hydrolase [Chloroflexota bacterium]
MAGSAGLLLIDSPIRTEDGREWLSALASQGHPRYLVLLDYHPDRVLGARAFDVPILAHDLARQIMSTWPDTYKGGLAPLGAEADRLKRVTGVREAIPELTFSDELRLLLGDREVLLHHSPGPTPASISVLVPESRLAFIGDIVGLDEPPFLGEADLQAWLESLDWLKRLSQQRYRLISSRDGKVSAEGISAMARFLTRVAGRLRKLAQENQPATAAAHLAASLLTGFHLPAARKEQALLRLQVGLTRLYSRFQSAED